jgi:hypothetical protein
LSAGRDALHGKESGHQLGGAGNHERLVRMVSIDHHATVGVDEVVSGLQKPEPRSFLLIALTSLVSCGSVA